MRMEKYGQEGLREFQLSFHHGGEISRLKEKVGNLKYVVGLIYKMMKSNVTRIRIKDIEVPTRPRKERSEESNSSNSEGEGGDVSPSVDLQSTSSNRVGARVSDFTARFEDVVQYLNIPLDVLEDRMEPKGEMIRASLEAEHEVELMVPSHVDGTRGGKSDGDSDDSASTLGNLSGTFSNTLDFIIKTRHVPFKSKPPIQLDCS